MNTLENVCQRGGFGMIPRYRAWDSWRKRMSVVDRIYIDTEGVRLYDDFGEYWRDFRDVKLMQSTGLRDKNDKEIFEGDILDYNGRKALVRWHGSYASFIYRFVDELQKRNAEWKPLYLAYMKCEIIGNIYENAELLEDKE